MRELILLVVCSLAFASCRGSDHRPKRATQERPYKINVTEPTARKAIVAALLYHNNRFPGREPMLAACGMSVESAASLRADLIDAGARDITVSPTCALEGGEPLVKTTGSVLLLTSVVSNGSDNVSVTFLAIVMPKSWPETIRTKLDRVSGKWVGFDVSDGVAAHY